MAYDGSRPSINDLRHPQYVANQENWEKWRLTYLGGSRFLRRYLRKFSRREDDVDFRDRMMISYVPAFAKAAINEVKNSIFQRMVDITREGGSKSYQNAVEGVGGGVDQLGSDMNTFIGRDILPELLTMKRVGIYVDMPRFNRERITKAEEGDKHPYAYWYNAEDIYSWKRIRGQVGDPTEFSAVLLRDSDYDYDDEWGLPYTTTTRYRYVWLDPSDGYVHVRYYAKQGDEWLPEQQADGNSDIVLSIRKIPFIMLELTDSLLGDVADIQISLLNLASSDMAYALKSNNPMYTEQTDMRTQALHMKQVNTTGTTQTVFDPTTSATITTQEKSPEIRVGTSYGRKYPLGAERPGFIAPPVEPLLASMEKQKQLKEEVRQLVLLAVSNLTTQRQSADSKAADDTELEAGLSYIGTELRLAERKFAEYWAMYTDDKKVATVHYPENYSLLSEAERQEQTKALQERLPAVSSLTFRRAVMKRIARILLGNRTDRDTIRKINQEIDADPVCIADPQSIEKDVEGGICDPETASLARGYPVGTAKKAEEATAKKLAEIAKHQSKPGLDGGPRGLPGADPKAGKKEKTASQKKKPTDANPSDRTRGAGK